MVSKSQHTLHLHYRHSLVFLPELNPGSGTGGSGSWEALKDSQLRFDLSLSPRRLQLLCAWSW